MYCVNCGVKLAPTEKACPLCGIRAWHPDLPEGKAPPLYPEEPDRLKAVDSTALRMVLCALFLLAATVCVLCDLQLSGGFSWSGYAVGGLGIFYAAFCLPAWFKNPNPVVIMPIVFLLINVLLLYISIKTRGAWYLTFGLPVSAVFGVVFTMAAGLLRYVAKGAVYVIGAAALLLGAFMPVMGYLLNLTFFTPSFAFWSLYPMISLLLIGATLIFLGLCRPARQSMKRKFFI